MPPERSTAGPDELEVAVSALRNVVGCRVERLESGEIETIHVLTLGHRPAKQIVRDIEAICATRFGLILDHRKVSIARLSEEAGPAGAGGTEEPLTLRSVQVISSRSGVEVVVRLRRGERIFEGRARGSGGEEAVYRTHGEAALAGISEAVGRTCTLSWKDMVTFPVGRFRAIVVSIELACGEVERKLLGAYLAEGDIATGVIEAVLQAANRDLHVLGGHGWPTGAGGG